VKNPVFRPLNYVELLMYPLWRNAGRTIWRIFSMSLSSLIPVKE
jgi:hypothetical protein